MEELPVIRSECQDSGPIISPVGSRHSWSTEHRPLCRRRSLVWASNSATHVRGVIPNVCRRGSTKALGCRYPTLAATVFTERPANSWRRPDLNRRVAPSGSWRGIFTKRARAHEAGALPAIFKETVTNTSRISKPLAWSPNWVQLHFLAAQIGLNGQNQRWVRKVTAEPLAASCWRINLEV